MVLPFIYGIGISLMTQSEFYRSGVNFIPNIVYFQNWIDAINLTKMYELFFRTSCRLIIVIIIVSFTSFFGGYAFGKLNFKGKKSVFILLLSSMMIAPQATLVPTFLLYARFPFVGGNDWMGQGGSGFINTFAILIVNQLVSVFGIFLLKQTFQSIPNDFEESARVDGAGTLRIMFQIYLPMIKPTLSAFIILISIGIWNDYMWPLITVRDISLTVLTVGISKLSATGQGMLINYPLLYSAYIIATIPMFFVFLFFQKYFVQGLTMSGIKG